MSTSRTIALIGAKGGCGTTLVTANLAAAAPAPHRTVAVDLDCGRGDLAGMLDLTPRATLPELFGPEADAVLLHGSAAVHRSGFSILGQPDDLSHLVRPTAAEVTRLLQLAGEAWELVLVDCGARVDEPAIAAIQHASHVLLVSTPDLLALRNLGRLHALLLRLGIAADRQWLALNKVPRHPSMAPEEIETLLHLPVTTVLPLDDTHCAQAMGDGNVLREVAPAAPLSRQFDQFWPTVFGEPRPSARHWWTHWIGGAA